MGRELVSAVRANKPISNMGDSFYSCVDCHACLSVCPAGVNAGHISHLSREVITSLNDEKVENPYARMIAKTTVKYMNPMGTRKQAARWARDLKFAGNSDFLLYTGNMFQLMSYTESMSSLRRLIGKRLSLYFAKRVAKRPWIIKLAALRHGRKMQRGMDTSLRNIHKLLSQSGVSFSYMGEDEPYPGTFLYDLGYIEEFRKYAKKVFNMILQTGKRRIITVDPHTYELLKNVYPKYVENFNLEIYYYIDLVTVEPKKEREQVVFHEPCHFVLRSPEYNSPSTVLSRYADISLPKRSGSRNRCCGGPDELAFPELSEKASEIRYDELKQVGDKKIVTACPICFANLAKEDRTVEIGDYIASRL